jgi:antigen 43
MATQIIGSGLTPVSPSATGVGDSLLVLSGGTALSASILGGTETIDGTDSQGTVTSHGVAGIYAGGLAIGTLIEDRAVQTVQPGGSARDATITGSGWQIVSAGASVQGSLVESGGFEAVSGLGITLDGTIAQGGTLALQGYPPYSGHPAAPGIAQNLSVLSGGFAVVSADGVIDGGTIANGGIVFALSNGAVTGVDIAASGYLVAIPGSFLSGDTGPVVSTGILMTQGTDAVINGFAPGDIIDLRTVSGSDLSASLTSAGMLDVTSGSAIVANFQLSGTQPSAGTTVSVSTDPDTGDALVTLTAATTADGGSVAGNAQPIDIPLYLVPFGDGFKVGIEVSLNGGQTYEMEEFDTGASGFFSAYNAAWWSSYTVVSNTPVVMNYSSGNAYNSETVSTDLTLQTTDGAPLSIDDATVGLITSAQNNNGRADLCQSPWQRHRPGDQRQRHVLHRPERFRLRHRRPDHEHP